jgi:hypothetical protein
VLAAAVWARRWEFATDLHRMRAKVLLGLRFATTTKGGAQMPTYEIALNAFFIALVVAVIVGGLVWSILTQHRVAGYEDCRIRHRLQISVRLVPVDPPTRRPRGIVQFPLA